MFFERVKVAVLTDQRVEIDRIVLELCACGSLTGIAAPIALLIVVVIVILPLVILPIPLLFKPN